MVVFTFSTAFVASKKKTLPKPITQSLSQRKKYVNFFLLHNYFATGPLAPSGFGVTIALNFNKVVFGHVLAVTVIVLF
jgi:hypothetical protein